MVPPAVDQFPVFRVQVTKVTDPDQGITAITIIITATISISIISSIARVVITTKAINSDSSSSNPDIRVIRRS